MPNAMRVGPATCSAVLTMTTIMAAHDPTAQGPQQRAEQAQRAGADVLALGARVVVALLAVDAGDGRHADTSSFVVDALSSVWLSSSSDEITKR